MWIGYNKHIPLSRRFFGSWQDYNNERFITNVGLSRNSPSLPELGLISVLLDYPFTESLDVYALYSTILAKKLGIFTIPLKPVTSDLSFCLCIRHFLRAIAASRVLAIVWASVCLSVCYSIWYCVKTTQAMITRSTYSVGCPQGLQFIVTKFRARGCGLSSPRTTASKRGTP